MTIIYFILILSITVLVHEFGHFMFAKKFGVHVYEFSLGMGPRIFKFNRKNDETDYSIRLLPIGGYVQMAGEEIEVDEKIPVNKRLQSKPAHQRFMIMIAGVMMNFLLAIILYFFIAIFTNPTIDRLYIQNSTIEGLSNNEKIVAIDNNFVNNYDKLALELTVLKDKKFNMTVKSDDGNKKNIVVNPISINESNLLYEHDYGFKVNKLEITDTNLDELKVEDKIVGINDKKISTYLELINELKIVDYDKFSLNVISKDGIEKNITIEPKKISDDKLSGYSYGFYLSGKSTKGLFDSIKYAFFKFFSAIEQMIFTVIYLITGKISLSMLSGPVGIFNAVSVYSNYGFVSLISLLCLICVNVGFINILPLPAFDGGHVLFIIIEKIKGSKVDPKVENLIHNIGFILLMILMVLVTYNDIIRLF